MHFHTRSQVLSLYKRALRLSRSWKSASGFGVDTEQERDYISNEAKKLFKENKHETSEDHIKELIREGESRLGLAQHYGTPYPRLMNIPQNVLPFKGKPKFKRDQRVMQQATPIYLQSAYNTEDKHQNLNEENT